MDTNVETTQPGTSSPTVRAFKEITFGSIAGIASKIFEHPFDLTKVRLQSQVLQPAESTRYRFTGPVDCLVKTWKNEGVRGLYRGLPAPIVGAMAENASIFLSYTELQNLIRWTTGTSYQSPLSLGQLALAGAGAGAITSFILTPIELIKCKMQVQMLVSPPTSSASPSSRPPLPGPITLLRTTIQNTGFRGLWLGQTGTLIRETGGTAAWLGTKEFVASWLVSRRIGSTPTSPSRFEGKPLPKPSPLPYESAIAGACAGASFNLILFPADTVKSTMQTAEELSSPLPTKSKSNSKPPPLNLKPPIPIPTSPSPSPSPPRPSPSALQIPIPSPNLNLTTQNPKPTFLSTFRALYSVQGIRGLYAGCGITVLRSIPSSALIFVIYDGLVARFG